MFSIPRTAIINVLTSDLPKKLPSVFEESTTGLEDADNEADEEADANTGAPDSWVSLILILLYEFLQGDQSKWKPYLDVLPQSFDTLMFWSHKELDELQASAISAKVGRDEAENMFRARVFPVIEQHADIFYPQGAPKLAEDELLLLAHQVGSTIMAYAFDLEKDEEDEEVDEGDEWVEDKEGKIMMGMVPMADILNADAKPNVGALSSRPREEVLDTNFATGSHQPRRRCLDGNQPAAHRSRHRDSQLLRPAWQRRAVEKIRLCHRDS